MAWLKAYRLTSFPIPICRVTDAGRWVWSGCCRYALAALAQSPNLAVEEALYDSRSMRAPVGIDLGHRPVPHQTKTSSYATFVEVHGPGKVRME